MEETLTKKTCSNCNTEMNEIKHCPNCNNVIETDMQNPQKKVFCTSCGQPMEDAFQCPDCKTVEKKGADTPETPEKSVNNFCMKCGAKLDNGTKFCASCGAPADNAAANPQPVYNNQYNPVPNNQYNSVPNNNYNPNTTYNAYQPNYDPQQQYAYQPNIVQQLSSRVKTDGIIWIVIGALQILAGLILLVDEGGWSNLAIIVIGGLNIFNAINDLGYSKTVLTYPVEIPERFKPITNAIIVLIYNLFIGGIIGVAGSIYYLIGVRQFVMNNEMNFKQIEQQFLQQNQQ